MTAATDTAPPNDQPNDRAAVAARPKAPINLGGPQTDFDSLYRLASNLSYAQLLPAGLRGKPADVLLIMMYGQELGLSAIQSIQGIYIVNGRPQIAGQTWLAKLTDAGHTYDIEHFAGGCKVTITRGDNGRSHTETFTIEDARQARLATKDTYQQYPKRMLMWRAVSDCATVIAPDVALGFGIGEVATETIQAQATREPGPALAAVVAARQHEQAAPEPPAPAADPREPVDAEIVTDITGGTPVPEEEPAKPDQADIAAAYAAMNEAAAAPAKPAKDDDYAPAKTEVTDEDRAYAESFWNGAAEPAGGES